MQCSRACSPECRTAPSQMIYLAEQVVGQTVVLALVTVVVAQAVVDHPAAAEAVTVIVEANSKR